MMEFKQTMYVDENKNIVTVTETIMTPEEFLRRNSEVFMFAQAMQPGIRKLEEK